MDDIDQYNHMVSSIMRANRKRAKISQIQDSKKSKYVSLTKLKQIEHGNISPKGYEFYNLMIEVYGSRMTQDESMFFCVPNPLKKKELFSHSFWIEYEASGLSSNQFDKVENF